MTHSTAIKHGIKFIIVIIILLVDTTESLQESRNSVAAARLGAPLIEPIDEDITVNAGDNYSLRCESNDPITWVPFEDFNGHFNIETTHTPDQERPHGSILNLIDIDYKYVGFYYCIKKESYDKQINSLHENIDQLESEYQISSIYMFVNDSENLLANAVPVVTAIQYQDVIIPCKPTMKSVIVKLTKDDELPHHFEYANYDARIGYTVKLMYITDSGLYYCRTEPTETTDETVKDFVITVDSDTKFINRPKIQSQTGLYGTQGDELHLNCTLEVLHGTKFEIIWILPNDNISQKKGRALISETRVQTTSNNFQIGVSELTILNVDKTQDEGYYKCEVRDSSNKNSAKILVTILDKNQGSIEIFEPSGKYTIRINANKRAARWNVKYKGYPPPALIWYDNNNVPIPWPHENAGIQDKYEVIKTDDTTQLVIKQLELYDSGTYTLKAYNDLVMAEKKFELIILDKPVVQVNDSLVTPGEIAHLQCMCVGYPESEIKWTFKPCPISHNTGWPNNCNDRKLRTLNPMDVRTKKEDNFLQLSEIKIIADEPGEVECVATNTEGADKSMAKMFIGDLLGEHFAIWGTEDIRITAGDSLTIYCGALIYKYSGELNWYFNDKLIKNTEHTIIKSVNSAYSYQKHLHWPNISLADAGVYDCKAGLIDKDEEDTKKIDVHVDEPMSPNMEICNFNDKPNMEKSLGEPLRLICKFSGSPAPKIAWYKDDQLIDHAIAGLHRLNDTRIELVDDSTILDIKFIMQEDEGQYKCVATNRLDQTAVLTNLKISNLPAISKGWIIGISALILFLIAITTYLCYRVRRERKLLRELAKAGLKDFEKGNPDLINPELALDEQADLLPYDKKYEFPRDKLKLGKQVGAGAFGVVVKGIAYGILPNEQETTVAVKMVKHTADNEIMRALVSELKIMVHLGQHLNVVNLLGAVTKNISKREVMVIVEYCRYGNLQNFLIKHRSSYIDQIIPETDKIDPNILTKEQRWSNDSGYVYNSKGLKYVLLSFSNNQQNQNNLNSNKLMTTTGGGGGGGGGGDRTSSKRISDQQLSPGFIRQSSSIGVRDYFPGDMNSANTDTALIRQSEVGGEDNLVLSNNSVQPAWRSNYKMDYKGPIRMVTTTDLVCWSFQIARGMDYLASRRVLHGDLAARNILLCDDNVVKICDFGLARNMYKSDNYKKKGEAPLPFKWLAIESIGDQVFSTYSDIWSFGIVMWELFSLGKVPYPGMEANEGLYFKLKDGYRMEKPPNATQEIYDIMLQCWSANPESRPAFAELEHKLAKQLENGVSEHYIDLNQPYLQVNIDETKDGKTDYLAALATPDAIAPPVPNYINTNVPVAEDYLTMNPNSARVIFSPTAPPDTINSNDRIFQYPTISSPSKLNKSDAPRATEEIIPMLLTDGRRNSGESDTEISTTNFGNIKNSPSKPIPAYRDLNYKNVHGDNINSSNSSNINKSNPQQKQTYVNVPLSSLTTSTPTTQQIESTNSKLDTKKNVNAKDAVSNPGYVIFDHVNETRT